MRIALAQVNTTVGDLDGNRDLILRYVGQSRDMGCDLVAFPELCVTGYPPEDLLLRSRFVADQRRIAEQIAAEMDRITCVFGFVHADPGGNGLYNAAAVAQSGAVRAIYRKKHLPNYSVFDEERYFEPGEIPMVLVLNGVRVGISICEDIWIPDSITEAEALMGGAEILLNISASPYYRGKAAERLALLQAKAERCRCAIAYVNLVGGQDELVFDGNSLVLDDRGRILAQGAGFEQDMIAVDIDLEGLRRRRGIDPGKGFVSTFPGIEIISLAPQREPDRPLLHGMNAKPAESEETEVYAALMLGLRDYVLKNGFGNVTLGVSGGIDSALVAALAADALGPENVIAVSMPSPYSSEGSVVDSDVLCSHLGIKRLSLPIDKLFKDYTDLLRPVFGDREPDITEENLQARIRANLLMALSNKFGWLVLSTGNKSEVSVGYSTLYGDSVGGFSPLKDVPKTLVYRLARFRNQKAGAELIPRSILDKKPSAELRPDQIDEDTLPPYEELDPILERYVEEEMGVAEIAGLGHPPGRVREVVRMVERSEFKRRQAAPGCKITRRAFGKDRRMPITNKYRT